MSQLLRKLLAALSLSTACVCGSSLPLDCAQTVNGVVQGTIDQATGIREFKGIPFAAPPVGDFRWREPQPVANWEGIRKADHFGPRAMQRSIFSDMQFRSDGVSEDCLYLNVWTPAKSAGAHLPVLVYFYGGGLVAGDGSEYRYDGESMARKGIVALTVNYRLSVFGFLAHPELTKESPHHASGNYGLLDQYAALEWVKKNIAAFGGDPRRVTIAGESAGSISVSAQMASPLSKNLFAGAIGESGSLMGALTPTSLDHAEENGVKFATKVGANSLSDLRALSADKLLEATADRNTPHVGPCLDGWFLPRDPVAIFTAGEEARVPLLVGWNSEEGNHYAILGRNDPTPENFAKGIEKLYGNDAAAIEKVYSGSTPDEILQAATDLASDRFIAFSTWRWSDLQRKTSGRPVYRYYFSHPRPALANDPNSKPGTGAVHASDIEYIMGNLPSNKVYAWTMDDYLVSETFQNFVANFIKTGNPNGDGLPKWPANSVSKPVEVMHIDVQSEALPEAHADRYAVQEQLANSH